MSINQNPNGGTVFDQFQIEEYKNISNSHFEALKQVSTFFRYYLLLLSTPVLIVALIGKTGHEVDQFFGGEKNAGLYDFTFIYLAIISFTGFCILLYIISIRHDSILYARTVNKSRKYFYDQAHVSKRKLNDYKGLPTDGTQPKFFDPLVFFPVVLALGIINSGFLGVGLYIKKLHSEYIFNFSFFGDIQIKDVMTYILLGYIFLHVLIWWGMSHYRESSYSKSIRNIGGKP